MPVASCTKKNSILRTGTLMISDKSKSNYIVQVWPFTHFLHVLIFFENGANNCESEGPEKTQEEGHLITTLLPDISWIHSHKNILYSNFLHSSL